MASTASRWSAPSRSGRYAGSVGAPVDAIELATARAVRCTCSRDDRGSDRLEDPRRLLRPIGAGARRATPGAVRSDRYANDRGRGGAAHATPAFAGKSTGAGDARSCGLLAQFLLRGSQGAPGPLPEA